MLSWSQRYWPQWSPAFDAGWSCSAIFLDLHFLHVLRDLHQNEPIVVNSEGSILRARISYIDNKVVTQSQTRDATLCWRINLLVLIIPSYQG